MLAAREAVMAPLRPTLRKMKVTEQQWRVLRVLADTDHSDARNLADAALLHAPSITRITRELETRGLLERRPDPHDGRRSRVAITSEGRRLVDRTAKETIQMLENYAQAFGTDRLDRLRSELKCFNDAIARFAPKE